MDPVLALINLVDTQFLGYESPQEFAKAIEKPPGLLLLLRKSIPRQNMPMTNIIFESGRPLSKKSASNRHT